MSFRPDIATARDLANYARRRGRRVALIRGVFDSLTPDDIDLIVRETSPTDDDDVVVAVDSGPALYPLEARLRLARVLITGPAFGLALAVDPNDSALAEAVQPDVVIDLAGVPERHRPSRLALAGVDG